MYEYKAFVEKVVDADTFDVIVDLGFNLKYKIRIRINNYDAPETWRPLNEKEAVHGHKATSKAEELILNKDIKLRTYKLGIYGRYSADIILSDGMDYASMMKSLGFEKLTSYE